MTAGEIARATGRKRDTIAVLLVELAKTGELVKAQHGYQLPNNAHRTTR